MVETPSDATSPSIFVSYSWSSPEHEARVIELAEALVGDGIHVVIDKWDLRAGADANAFMERMVTDDSIDKVVMVCDRAYAEKADARRGGAGTEAQIITPELYGQEEPAGTEQRFLAVVAEKDEEGKPYLPTFYKGRIYVDLSDDARYAEEYERLVRWIFGKPVHQRPTLGTPPAYVTDEDAPRIPTSVRRRKAVTALEEGRPSARGAVLDFLTAVADGLDAFEIDWEDERDLAARGERVIANVEAFRPVRDEVVAVITAAARYGNSDATAEALRRIFGRLLLRTDRPAGARQWSDADFDNFRVITQELFLYVTASLLREVALDVAAELLAVRFYTPDGWGRYESESGSHGYDALQREVRSLEAYERREAQAAGRGRKLSPVADVLRAGAEHGAVSFDDLQQADLTLYLRSVLDARRAGDEWRPRWWPDTLLYTRYRRSPFELFARAESKAFFDRLLPVLGATEAEFDALAAAYRSGEERVPRWEGGLNEADILRLIGYDRLRTRP